MMLHLADMAVCIFLMASARGPVGQDAYPLDTPLIYIAGAHRQIDTSKAHLRHS